MESVDQPNVPSIIHSDTSLVIHENASTVNDPNPQPVAKPKAKSAKQPKNKIKPEPNPGFVAIGNYIYLGSFEPSFNQSEDFIKLGINVVMNCGKEIVYPKVKYPFILENFPVTDGNSVSMLEQMDRAAERIKYHLSKKRKIYLHCVNGLSVSPAMLIYYLMAYKSINYDRAHNWIRKLKPDIDVHFEFENQLRVIEEN